MKPYLTGPLALVLALVLAISAFQLVSCAPVNDVDTPREQYLTVLDAYIPTLQALIVLHEEGVISDKEWEEWVIPTVARAQHLRAILDAQTQAGIPIANSETLKALIVEIKKLIHYKLQKEKERKARDVDPASRLQASH